MLSFGGRFKFVSCRFPLGRTGYKRNIRSNLREGSLVEPVAIWFAGTHYHRSCAKVKNLHRASYSIKTVWFYRVILVLWYVQNLLKSTSELHSTVANGPQK